MTEVPDFLTVECFVWGKLAITIHFCFSRKIGKCTYCDKKFESAPVELPCKHLLCNSCYRDCYHGSRAAAKCPECKTPVPADFDPTVAACRDRYF